MISRDAVITILSGVEKGLSHQAAAALAGVSEKKFRSVLDRAAMDIADGKKNRYTRFVDALGKSDMVAQAALSESVQKAAIGRTRKKRKLQIDLTLPWADVAEQLGLGEFPGVEAGVMAVAHYVATCWKYMQREGLVKATEPPPRLDQEEWTESNPYIGLKLLAQRWPGQFGRDVENSGQTTVDEAYL